MEDFKDGCKLICETMLMCVFLLFVGALLILFLAKHVYAEEGPYKVVYSSSPNTCPNDPTVIHLSDCEAHETTEITLGNKLSQRCDGPIGSCREYSEDLAEALNAAHERRAGFYVQISSTLPTWAHCTDPSANRSDCLNSTGTVPCTDSK